MAPQDSDTPISLAATLLSSDPEPAAIIDSAGIIIAANGSFLNRFGSVNTDAPIVNLEKTILVATRSRSPIPIGLFDKSADRVRGTIMRIGEGYFVIRPRPVKQAEVFNQLTEKLRTINASLSEKSLKESALRVILNAAVEGIAICDAKGRIRKKNTALVRMVGPVQTLEELFSTPDWKERIGLSEGAPKFIRSGPRPATFHLNETVTHTEFTVGYARTVDGPLFILVFHDMTERERLRFMEQAVSDADRDAKLSKLRDEAKTRFLSMISHELRTPLNGVISALELINSRNIDDPELLDLLRIATVSSTSALDQVNRILEITRLETRISSPEVQQSFLPVEIISSVLDEQNAVAVRRNNNLRHFVNGHSDTPVVGDPYLFRQIVQNLIGNAIKFTQNGSVTIETDIQDVNDRIQLLFTVSDTGKGFSMDQKDRLLKEFETGNDNYTRIEEGAGIGLALVAGAIEKLGGKLNIQSEPGKGSCFQVELSFAQGMARQLKETAKQPMIPKAFKLRILVVDDIEINRQILSKTLEKFGCSVAVAVNGEDALRQLAEGSFDIVFMDISMPEMDGMEATRIYRQMESRPSPLFIVGLTAHDDPLMASSCIEAGMNLVEVKPLRVARLNDVLTECQQRISDLERLPPEFPDEPYRLKRPE